MESAQEWLGERIAAVTQNGLINLRPVILTFEKETLFGGTVIFMPRTSFRLFSEDEIVGPLQSGRSQCPLCRHTKRSYYGSVPVLA